MKPRLLMLLLLCAAALTACYRQTEEPFQQVDSAAVISALTPTSLQDVVDAVEDASGDGEDAAETREYITPETVPGQVEQPTLELPTEISLAATSPSLTITPFLRATATLSFEEALDPNHECVYTVQSGDNLFRLSLSWNTTVQEIMDASRLEDDALAIGQLLLRPGCDYAPPAPRPTVAPQPAISEPTVEEPPFVDLRDDALATTVGAETSAEGEPEATASPTAGPRIHVVSAGETIESISLSYRVDVNQLIALNNLANPNQLAVGQELYLPD